MNPSDKPADRLLGTHAVDRKVPGSTLADAGPVEAFSDRRRTCARCDVERELAAFPTVRGGRSVVCADCTPKRTCIACGDTKVETEFCLVHRDGQARQSRCKSCDGSRVREHKGERSSRSCRFCAECAGMPHRVVGPRCRTCGLLYADEKIERAVIFTASPIARCEEGA